MNENTSNHKTLKMIIVLLAIAFIVAAGIIAGNREKLAKEAEAAKEAEEAAAKEGEITAIDQENALIIALVPSMPDTVSFNGLTKSDCEAAVSDGSMIKLKSEGGATVYINNYRDNELLRASVKSEDEFKSWLYTGYAVFDADEEHVRSIYDANLKGFAEYLRDSEGITLQSYINDEGISVDEFMAGQMEAAYHYVCDLEMAEAMLTDTIGDVSEDDIAGLAANEGYESAEEFINKYGRDSILYYLRPLKLVEYLDQRLEEIK